MNEPKLVKIEITKQDGSKKNVDLPQDNELTVDIAETVKLVTEDNLVALLKTPDNGPLVVILENSEGQQQAIKVNHFFSSVDEGQDSPQIIIVASNIEGAWVPPDFITTPSVAFSPVTIQAEGLDAALLSAVDPFVFERKDIEINDDRSTSSDILMLDSEELPTISIADAENVTEGGIATFMVTLSKASSKMVTVEFDISDDTLISMMTDDLASGLLTFNPGETSKAITLQVLDDNIDTPDKDLHVYLSNAENASILDDQGDALILDNSEPPNLLISNAGNVTEGGVATFVVTLSEASGKTVTVAFNTSDGTAIAGENYDPKSGLLTFNPGETSKTIIVQTFNNATDETNKDFHVDLSDAVNASIIDNQGDALILNNDMPPMLSISDAADVDEGGVASFVVTLSEFSGKTITVGFDTSDGTAIAGEDYDPVSGLLTFHPGEISKTITVQTHSDGLDEANEDFHIDLSNAVNASILDNQGDVLILDNDAPPTISIGDAEDVTEGDMASFVVTLSDVSGKTVTVAFDTSDGTAIAGEDYDPVSGLLTFHPGETSKTITVQTLNDGTDEANKDFHIDLSNAVNASILDNQGDALILDNNAPPTLSISDAEDVTEGGVATFVVGLSEASEKTVTVAFDTSDGTAIAGEDYDPVSGLLTFHPGETSKTITVQTLSDGIDEANKDFHIDLSNAVNASILDNQGDALILDNNAPPTLSISDAEDVTEGGVATFVVSLSEASGKTVTVAFDTSDGAAIAGEDYDPVSGLLTFHPGETSKTIIVQTHDDSLDEANEDFHIDLSNAVNASILDNQGDALILDNDAPPTISIADAEDVTEGEIATFVVTLSEASGKTITVAFDTSDGTAISGDDYDSASGLLTFHPGETSKTISVQTLNDSVDELDEHFHVGLSHAVNAVIIDSQGDANILDNSDILVSISNGEPSSQKEPFSDDSTVEITFTISLNIESLDAVSVDYETVQGGGPGGGDDATSGLDYEPISGTVVFAPGETEKEVTVAIKADDLVEDLEYFQVVLSDPVNATIDVANGIGIIEDRSIIGKDNSDNDFSGSSGHNALVGDAGGTVLVEIDPVVNIVYVLDTSGSMGDNNRLNILKAAVKDLNEDLLALVDQGATVSITIVSFSGEPRTSTSETIALTSDTISELNGENGIVDSLTANGFTSYTEALFQTQDVVSSFDTGSNVKNTVVFVSDGNPLGSKNTRFSNHPEVRGNDEPSTYNYIMNPPLPQQPLVSQFWPFLLSNDVTTRAIGVGNGAIEDSLAFIDNEGAPIIVEDEQTATDLSEVLRDIVFSSIEDAPLGMDTIQGQAGDDVIFGDALISPVDSDYTFDEIITNEFNGNQSELLAFLLDPTNDYANAKIYTDSDRGEADLIYGGDGNDAIFGQGGDDDIHGGAGDDFLSGGAGVDTIAGDAGDDVILFEGAANGVDVIDGGADTDTLRFDVTGETLDLTLSTYDNKFVNLEQIDLGKNGNTLVIDPDDVLEISGNNQIIIDGDATDTVEGSNWTDQGSTVIMNTTYHEYSGISGGASVTLLVDEQITQVL